MWKSINELEKQKEMIIGSVAMTSNVQLSNSADLKNEEESDDDNIDDIDFNVLDWRTKTI
jgi:hypothetical protein